MSKPNSMIPNQPMTAADVLRLARQHDVPGTLVSSGRKNETRAYPVLLDSGAVLQWQVTAPASLHYTGVKS
jgi:hypothetical protein